MIETSKKSARAVTGKVASDKMDKTITVVVERLVKHPLYGKYLRRRTKLIVHDQDNTSRQGDTVTVVQCRPLSKRKSWKLVDVVERANAT